MDLTDRDLTHETADTLAAIIRDDIRSGRLAGGARLPSIRQLVQQQGAGRGVAEKAMERLRAEGLVEARHGSGNYVRGGFTRIQRVSPDRLAQEQWGTGKAIQDHDTSPRPRTVDVVVGDVDPPLDVAEALGTPKGAKVLSRSRRFLVERRPVQLATSWLPTDLTRGTQIEHTDTGDGGTYARLGEQGWGPTHFVERMIGRGPLPEEADAGTGLDLRRGAMVFEITRFAYAGERCVEVTRMILDAEAYEVVFAFPARKSEDQSQMSL